MVRFAMIWVSNVMHKEFPPGSRFKPSCGQVENFNSLKFLLFPKQALGRGLRILVGMRYTQKSLECDH